MPAAKPLFERSHPKTGVETLKWDELTTPKLVSLPCTRQNYSETLLAAKNEANASPSS